MRRKALHAAATTAAIAAIVLAFPHLLSTSWAAIREVGAATSPLLLSGLLLLWLAGLAAHTITLTGALPGLTSRRALLLSLTGSAVSNVLPLGGAAGIALNQRMTGGWGFSNREFTTYTVVTNVWDVLAKALVPILVVPVLLFAGPAAHHATHLLATSAVVLPGFAALVAAALLSPSALDSLQRQLETSQVRRGRSRWRTRAAAALAACERARVDSAALARQRWRRLSSGMLAYTALLLGLLVACLHVTGAGVPFGLVVVAFCCERLLTLVGLTPGGLGLVEIGLAGVLMFAPGASGAGVAGGVLLYRLLTFGLEIPVGGVLLAGWTWQRLRAGRAAAADAARAGVAA